MTQHSTSSAILTSEGQTERAGNLLAEGKTLAASMGYQVSEVPWARFTRDAIAKAKALAAETPDLGLNFDGADLALPLPIIMGTMRRIIIDADLGEAERAAQLVEALGWIKPAGAEQSVGV